MCTDCKALVSVLNCSELSDLSEDAIMTVLSIQNYNFHMVYVKGKLNVVSDYLSRRPKWGKLDWSEETGDLLEMAAMCHQAKFWSVLECPWLLEM